jgi:hypothetical protein
MTITIAWKRGNPSNTIITNVVHVDFDEYNLYVFEKNETEVRSFGLSAIALYIVNPQSDSTYE